MILKLDNSAQIFNLLSDIPGEITDADELLEVCTCMYIACAKALHCRSRVSFRVLLSRDFSRIPQMESFLAGYYVPLVNKSIPSVS